LEIFSKVTSNKNTSFKTSNPRKKNFSSSIF